ncbi:hypothetical protein CHLRE_16g677920v5 [Chlamydomonas reinhardtii]|uniref:Uncharacterized protein n=1 Tax=Chlamydomonas reinhardtii TaxID=3055 RepID=A0A2K3CV92_CHLRE|nr:uncharacterized protein CHLRE_16g677920v5 [Chlamydomonas reinhardtii]PNW72203.1 hypothetical protein CHLRE_16g677920v5 [Chlamydomonas reinhardtii]
MRPRTVACCLSQASGSSDERFYEPALSFPSAIGKPEVDAVKAMVQNNFSDEVILSILQALVAKAVAPVKDELVLRNMMLNTQVGELNTQVARLQGELNLTMAQYLNILGLLHMRGLMEYIQDTMHTRTNVQWDTTKAKDCWRAYLGERKNLQECLKKNNVSSTDAPDALTKMYGTLSTAVYDSRSPEEYQQTNTKLYIGPPLQDSRQRAMMACLCKDVNVAYDYRV